MTDIHYLRICALRSVMALRGWDAVVLRSSDPHSSEYLAPRYMAVTYMSGFTGEAADLVITLDEAGLWTDSRYFIQANRQLEGTGIILHKTRLPDSVGIPQWLASKGFRTVACDSLCESQLSMEEIRQACSAVVSDFSLVGCPDLVSLVWEDRPGIPHNPITTVDASSVGLSRMEKIEWLRGEMALKNADYFLVSELDQIAWILNVRGSDIEYNPLVLSYLLVGNDSVRWFALKDGELDSDTLDSIREMEADDVSVEKYDGVFDALTLTVGQGYSVMCDPVTTNAELYSIAGDSVIAVPSPVPLKKAVKTAEEIEGMREAFLEDGLAMEKFLYWLENEVTRRAENGERPVSEWEASQYLCSLRSEIPGYRGDSFETISAWGPAAALPHYSTPHEDTTFIYPKGLYLCDSGGQYIFGTTDITRTVPVGETTYLEKEDYTLVLKGMIALSKAVFPYGTAGCQIDAIAREPLWNACRNFGHGTGHGIGFYLCVHEGPQSIRQNFLSQPLLPGMITSNEPGLYREGSHGIRHENVILCCNGASDDDNTYENEFGRWLSFETLTCCHLDTAAVLPGLLTREETAWLNSYNEHVYNTLSPAIEDEDFDAWLRGKTMPL